LVLILVITVTNSHASARRDAELAASNVKDSADVMEVVSDELVAQRESLKKQVERRRRDLADIEDHIQRLTKNLQELASRIEQIQSHASDTEKSESQKEALVLSLREQIDAKKKELLEEIENQKKRKPAFAVIPYVGNNGTSRRPVYLECTKQGVVIQPEGMLISVQDLKPPTGPGNPLDSALRVLRLAYQQRDVTFGINQPPYPLLLVRPDGIHTYAMALEAMSGWDDQYGYELINGDMDLTFPTSIPGLNEQLTQTVEVARARQRAMIASMPRAYSTAAREESWDSIDASIQPPAGPAGNSGSDSANRMGSVAEEGAESMKDWQLVQGMANSQVTSSIQQNAMRDGLGAGGSPSQPNPMGQNPIVPNQLSGQYVISQNGNPGSTAGQVPDPSDASGMGGERVVVAEEPQFNEGSFGSQGAGGEGGSQSVADSQSHSAQGGTGSSATGSRDPNASTSPTQPRANAFSSGSATGDSAQSNATPEQIAEMARSKQTANSDKQSSDGKNSKGNVSSGSKAKHVNPDGDLKPISVSAGQDWAASRAVGKATPVTRTINVVVLKDRWLLRSDVDPKTFDADINMQEGPQEAGNQLATVLKKRVDSWGLSLPGGYWSPTLTIESASDAQQSVARLQRLLEGSGIEIRVVPLTIPKQR
jgi:archaellum component FlaC